MSGSHALIATTAASLDHLDEGGVAYTDFWDVLVAGRKRGLDVRDLRELIRDEPERVDAAVADWASWTTALTGPAWNRVPLVPSLRADLVWRLFFPIARHGLAAYAVAENGNSVTVDLPAGTAVGDAVIAGVRAGGGRVDQLAGGVHPELPASHKPIGTDIGSSLQRYRAFKAASPLISLPTRAAGRGLASRPRIALAYYPSLSAIVDRLAADAWFALWPWALPPPRRAVEMIAGGGLCLDHSTPANAGDLAEVREEFSTCVSSADFDLSGIDFSGVLRPHLERAGSHLLRFALYRTAATLDALTKTQPEAVLVPFDVGLSAAPLVLAAKRLGIPSILVQHGAEASRMPGDKLLAANVLVWSDRLKQRYAQDPEFTGTTKFRVTGPAMLEPLSDLRPARPGAGRTAVAASRVLFLSYPVRHNMACDSWMAPEYYIAMLAEAVRLLPDSVRVVGIKIHPSESAEHYRRVMSEEGLSIPLITEGLVPDAIGDADMVVGPESTGLLEAWAAGRTPVCINLSGITMSPPFDESTEIPVATSAVVLAEIVRRWHEREWSFPEPAPALVSEVGDLNGAVERAAAAVLDIARGGVDLT